MGHGLFKEEVYLEPVKHQYFDNDGNQYISFSALYGKLVKKFDAEMVARNISKNSDKSADDYIAQWQQATDNGTRIDKALELYAQTKTYLESDQDLKARALCEVVLSKYDSHHKCHEQGIPYSKEYRVAGSWDKLSVVSNRKDSRVHISDFKCFEKGEDSLYKISGQAWLNKPFDHLPNNKYTKISLQLSFYAHLFEELTGRKVERLFIDLIVPTWEGNKLNSFNNQVVPVQYLKNDVRILLDVFKKDIEEMLNNQNVSFAIDGDIF